MLCMLGEVGCRVDLLVKLRLVFSFALEIENMMETDAELVTIPINYKGQDFQITVDLETANILLNDQELAESYILEAYPQLGAGIECNASAIEDSSSDYAARDVPLLRRVWFSKGRPTPDDDEATAVFLHLRQKFADKFNDRRTVKSILWNEIAKEMKLAGFDISANYKEGPGGKCKQKFLNMESKYLKHVKYMNSTGVGKKDPPPFYDELHSIIGGKDKSDPKVLQDSEILVGLETGSSAGEGTHKESFGKSDDTEEEPSTSSIPGPSKEGIKSRFSREKKTARPKNSTELILEEMKRQYELDQDDRRKAQQLMEVQNAQRAEMLNLFRDFVGNQKST